MAAAATPSPVKSAMRTLDLIEFVVAHGGSKNGGVVAQDISAALSIPVSSLSYLLATLVKRDYLVREGRSYKAGAGLLRLRIPAQDRSLLDHVAPLVRTICGEINETTMFTIREGWEAEVLCAEASAQALRYSTDPGQRHPLHAMAAGKALLAHLPEIELARYFAECERVKLTLETLTSEDDLRDEFDYIRAGGFAIARDEATPGICGIARAVDSLLPAMAGFCAPVFDFDRHMVLGIVALGSIAGFDTDWDGAVARALRTAAAQLSSDLGYKA